LATNDPRKDHFGSQKLDIKYIYIFSNEADFQEFELPTIHIFFLDNNPEFKGLNSSSML